MVQWVRVPIVKPEDLSSIPGTNIVKEMVPISIF